VALVGGKNASLGELFRKLSSEGVRVPDGLAITTEAYRYFMRAAGLASTVDAVTRGLDAANLAELAARGLAIRQAILGTAIPADLQEVIVAAYDRLGAAGPIDVAVRSSATAEDLPDTLPTTQRLAGANAKRPAAARDALAIPR
jgi:pyruvate,water dikinase